MSDTEAEIGYWIGVPYWGQGLIPEAVRELLRRCFEELNCTGVWCGYFDGNKKSKRVQEKCGFVYHHTDKDKPYALMNDIRTEHFTYLSKKVWLDAKENDKKSFIVRRLHFNETDTALTLVWQVFLKFEAPDYGEAGAAEFRRSVWDTNYLKALTFYGAFCGESLIGVLATRCMGSHIALFFVDGTHQRKGIGRALFKAACADCTANKMTVHSSPFAVPVYHALGFVDMGAEQTEHGIRFTPMKYTLRM